jgi:hypothetical protein
LPAAVLLLGSIKNSQLSLRILISSGVCPRGFDALQRDWIRSLDFGFLSIVSLVSRATRAADATLPPPRLHPPQPSPALLLQYLY